MADITGRDSYIVAKALAYAIEAIALLPEERQEWSDHLLPRRMTGKIPNVGNIEPRP